MRNSERRAQVERSAQRGAYIVFHKINFTGSRTDAPASRVPRTSPFGYIAGAEADGEAISTTRMLGHGRAPTPALPRSPPTPHSTLHAPIPTRSSSEGTHTHTHKKAPCAATSHGFVWAQTRQRAPPRTHSHLSRLSPFSFSHHISPCSLTASRMPRSVCSCRGRCPPRRGWRRCR